MGPTKAARRRFPPQDEMFRWMWKAIEQCRFISLLARLITPANASGGGSRIRRAWHQVDGLVTIEMLIDARLLRDLDECPHDRRHRIAVVDQQSDGAGHQRVDDRNRTDQRPVAEQVEIRMRDDRKPFPGSDMREQAEAAIRLDDRRRTDADLSENAVENDPILKVRRQQAERQFADFGPVDRFPVAQIMTLGGQQIIGFFVQIVRHKSGRRFGAEIVERDVDVEIAQVAFRIFQGARHRGDADLRVALAEWRGQKRDDRHGHRCDADPQRAFEFAVLSASGAEDQTVMIGQGLLAPGEDLVSFGSQALKTGLLPRNDRDSKVLLELLHGLRQCRLADRKRSGGTSEVPLLCQDDKIFQMLDLKVALQQRSCGCSLSARTISLSAAPCFTRRVLPQGPQGLAGWSHSGERARSRSRPPDGETLHIGLRL